MAEPAEAPLDEEVSGYIGALIERAAFARLPDLFCRPRPDALYTVENREGVSVRVLRTPQLSEDELLTLMKYRLAQYVAVNFVDPRMVYEARMEHEPLSGVSEHDVHLIAGSAET